MQRMSRAGRVMQIERVLMSEWSRNPSGWLHVGQIARRMGLKSSTYLKNVIREMCKNDDRIQHADINGCDVWRYRPYRQTDFFDRVIAINGKSATVRDHVNRILEGV